MTSKTSVKGIARQAITQDTATRRAIATAAAKQAKNNGPLATAGTLDSFVNFAHKLGMGADNALSTASYGYNPITRNRNLLEWIHRGSWLGGVAIDIVANDMTRAGIDFACEMDPEDIAEIESEATTLGIWDKLNETVKWGRLYGGCIGVMLIDGQDMRTPLRLETVGPDQFKGIYALDRWFVEPSLEDLVTEFGPNLGMPKFYRVMGSAPALRGAAIHHSRIVLRHIGVELPVQQALTENLWGVSVLERLYDRMIGFDSASTGIAQLVYKSYLRTLKIKDLRQVVAAGGKAMEGLQAYMEIMRRYQGIEGITAIDSEDDFEVQQTSAFSGVAGAIDKLGEQVSGALQVPLVRLFGQAPGGLNSDGESHLRNYYDSINQQQQKLMHVGVTNVYRALAQSKGIKLPDDFAITFASLWQLKEEEKAGIADKVGTAVDRAFDKGLIGRRTALQELRQSSRITGIFSNITRETIESADDEVLPPDAEQAMDHEHEIGKIELGQEHDLKKTQMAHEHQTKLAKAKEQTNGKPGQNGAKKPVGGGKERRKLV
jgi:uncharacterized protein